MIDEWEGTAWAGSVAAPPSGTRQTMTTLTRIARQSREDRVQTRTLDTPNADTLSELMLRAQGIRNVPWRAASIREALGVPVIYAAVTLISNVVGSLSMRAFRQGREVPADDRPRIIVRPSPFTTPREFYRATAYSMATRGEAWWWVAKRDIDDLAISVMPVPPHEITVTEDRDDALRPIIEWRGKRIPNEDMVQIPLMMEPGALRGQGPLQLCGAAVSVAVEAQEWAANFYASGGRPGIVIKSAVELGEDEDGNSEAQKLLDQWTTDVSNNVTRVIDPGIESIDEYGQNSQGSQMLDARGYSNSDWARAYHIPGPMLEAAMSGSSLTYQNLNDEWEELLRRCLRPDYLEPIEQTISDLLSRSTIAKFNVAALREADVKTRYEVYQLGIEKGIIDAEYAQRAEGIIPGDIENAPMPMALPQAVPTRLPIARSAEPVRCDGRRIRAGVLLPCGKLLAEAGPFVGSCPRCKKVYEAVPLEVRAEEPHAQVIPITVHRKAVPQVEAPKPDGYALVREMLDSLPERIAAAMPQPIQVAPPILQIAEGAFRSEVHMPPIPKVQKHISKDGIGGYIIEEK